MGLFDFSGSAVMNVGDKQLYIYSIDKDEELLKMNFEGIDLFLKSMDKLGRKAFGHTMILFDGYNDTATELHEIHEVRVFVKELFNRYPHVLNYISFELEGHNVLLSSLLDFESFYVGERKTLDEYFAQYGYKKPLPRYNVRLDLPKDVSNMITDAMKEHGRKLRGEKYAERQIHKFNKIFNK